MEKEEVIFYFLVEAVPGSFVSCHTVTLDLQGLGDLDTRWRRAARPLLASSEQMSTVASD